MKCPFCSHKETRVVDKRASEEKANRRRRECLKCHKRFTTYEKIENLITKVKKRNGKVVDFDQEKITEAIWKAAQSVGGTDRSISEMLSGKVQEELEEKFGGVTVPTVEQVQDIVEKILVENGHYKTAKAYILYREQHKKIRETKETFVEVEKTISSYLKKLDWRVKENSNEQYSFSGLLLYTAGRVMSNYNLNQVYTPAISSAHKSGHIHIHDLSHGVIGYCCGHSLKNLLIKGFGGVPNKVDCKAAKHLSTVIHQMVNYIGCLQMEFAGAQAFSVHPKETVVVRDRAGNISVERMGEFCDRFIEETPKRWLSPKGIEFADISAMGYEALSFGNDGKSVWKPIKRAIRHPVTDPLHLIRTNRGIISASKSHSLFSLNTHQYLGMKEKLLLESIENNGKKLFSYELGKRARDLGIKAPEKVVQKLVAKGLLNSEFLTYRGEARHFSKYTPRANKKHFTLKRTEEMIRLCKEVKTCDTEVSNIAALSKLNLPQNTQLDLYGIIRGSRKLRKTAMVRLDNPEQLKRDIMAKTTMRRLSLKMGKCGGYIFSALKQGKIPFEIYDRFSSVRGRGIRFLTNRNANSLARVLKGKELMGFVKLLAWYLSEGYATRYWIGITQKDKGHIREILGILDSLNLSCNISRRDVKAITVHGIAAAVIWELCGKRSSNKKIPGFVFALADRFKQAFLEEIVKGDGTKSPNGWVYTSTSNRLVTGLNILAISLDWRTSIKMRHTNNFEENLPSRLTRYDLVMNTRITSRIESHGDFESAVVFENQIPDFSAEYEYDLSVEGTESFVGGVGLFAMHNSSVDTLLAPFVKTDSLTYKQVKQNMQQLVFSLNIPSRWGSQYPFSNVTFDWMAPGDMKNEKAIVGGKPQDFTYGDCQREMDMINKSFIEVMLEGDANGRIFSFPIPTYNITKDFDWESENAKLLFEMTAKYGTPYFQNYVGSNLDPSSIRAMCLHPDEEIIVKIDGKIGKTTIGKLCEQYNHGFDREGWSENKHDIKVMGLDRKSCRLEWSDIKRFLKTTGSRLTSITTGDGKEIRVSSDHPIPVLTPDGIKLKHAGEIGKGEYLFTARKASDLLNKKLQQLGTHVIDRELAKFIGLFISEGNYLYDSRKPTKDVDSLKGFQFSFNSSELQYVREIMQIVKNKFNYQLKTKKDPRYNTMQLYLYNSQLAKEFYKAGLRKYNGVPSVLYNSPKEIIETFLEYFFKGDGYERGGELHIGDKALSRDIVLLYTLTGVPVTYRKRENSQVIRIQHNYGRGSQNKMHRDITYNRVPNFMVDFDNVATERRGVFKNAHTTVGLQFLNRFGGSTLETEKLLMNDIAVIGVEQVIHTILDHDMAFYDIELERNHLFVHSLGNITHNCCRLNINQNELMTRPGGMWGPGDSTGSIGVVTMNVSRMAYEARKDSKTPEEARKLFLNRLGHYMLLAKDSLEIKRKIIENNLKNGLMPYTRVYLGTFNNHFSTIGLCGMNEACLNLLGKDISTTEGKALTIEALEFMRDKCLQFQKDTGNLYNLEATPAESTAYRFGKLDKEAHPDIITSGEKEPYLTNSTQLPVGHTDDPIEAIEHQNDIQPLYTGGTIFHTFLGEKLSSGEAAKALVKKIAENTRLPYFSLTPTFSICPDHGYIVGEHFKCPKPNRKGPCGKETEVFSRIVGYYRPIKNWNLGKQEEFKDRLEFLEQKGLKGQLKCAANGKAAA